jgi:hypothetical protein
MCVCVVLLDDLEQGPVQLGEDLIAVFKFKADIVGLDPGYVLKQDKRQNK